MRSRYRHRMREHEAAALSRQAINGGSSGWLVEYWRNHPGTTRTRSGLPACHALTRTGQCQSQAWARLSHVEIALSSVTALVGDRLGAWGRP
jgi:hypothetical protein